jgi:pimeloyl-ACP methyl ester carboxylesterase
MALAWSVVVAPATASQGDEFYTPPDPLPPGQPGDVLRSRPIAPAFPGSAGVWHVLYRSSDVDSAPIAVSGTVLVPRAPFAGPRPLVVVTPGTRGIADKCAPSRQYQPNSASPQSPDYEMPVVTQLLGRGIVVVVTDYEGQGTPGLTSYLVGRPEGYAGLDALRAAQRLLGLTADGPVGIAGYSQGGQAAGWTAQLQPEYAPELNLAGVALGGVPADMNVEVAHLNGGRFAGFAFAALSGLDFAYPELALEKHLTAEGVEIMRQVREEDCSWHDWFVLGKWNGYSTSELTQPDVLTLPDWRQRFAESQLGTMPLPAPAYLYHGTADEVVPFRHFQLLRDDWCGKAPAVELQEFGGMNHGQTLEAGTVPAVQWLVDRFAGRPPRHSC